MPRPASVKPRRSTRAKSSSGKDAPVSHEADVSDIVMEIEDLADFEGSTNIILHGPIGHGKTVLAGGAPNATFLGADRGVVSAKRMGSKAGIMLAPDWRHFLAGVKKADEQFGPDDWLIVDTHNKAQRMYIRWLLKTINAENETRDLDIPALQDHQKWQNAFMRWTDHIIDAPYNVIFVCNSMTKTNSEGEDIVMPMLPGGRNNEVCEYICAQVDVIMYYTIASNLSTPDNTVRRAFTQPYVHPENGKTYVAKDHYGVFGNYQDVAQNETDAMREFVEMIRG